MGNRCTGYGMELAYKLLWLCRNSFFLRGKTGVTADRDKIEFRLFNSWFSSPPGAGKGMPWLSHLLTSVSISQKGLTTRGIMAFNFSPRNLTQVTSAMKRGKNACWHCFGKENNSSRRVLLKIEPELNNQTQSCHSRP